MVSLTMPLAMLSVSVVVVQEEMLVRAVSGKRNGSHPEAREQPLESVEAAERAIVPPQFTVPISTAHTTPPLYTTQTEEHSLPRPGILLSVERPGRRRGLELGDAEAGGVVFRHFF